MKTPTMTILLRLVLFATVLVSVAPDIFGQAANNPTGPAGEYNGSVTTAGSYDPYTGNAKRFVTDLSVTGAVGKYPLKWTRTLNTRNGGWTIGGYGWGLRLDRTPPPNQPDQYDLDAPNGTILYPDGRTVALQTQDFENYYPKVPFEGADRIVPAGNGNYDLLLGDGGIIKFTKLAAASQVYPPPCSLRRSSIRTNR